MIAETCLLLLSILYLSDGNPQNGQIECTTIKGSFVWKVHVSQTDGHQGSWFLCDLSSPDGKRLCSCDAVTAKSVNVINNSTDQLYSLEIFLRDRGCNRAWNEYCLQEGRIPPIIRRTLLMACLKTGLYRRYPYRHLRYESRRSQKLVIEYSQLIQNIGNRLNSSIREIPVHYTKNDKQRLHSMGTKISWTSRNEQETLVLSHEYFLHMTANYSKFAVARKILLDPQTVAIEIVQNWGRVYGLEYNMTRKGRVCFVSVWTGSEGRINDTVYNIVRREISQYFVNSSCSDCSVFIQKEANQTMYCVSKVGCITMDIGFDSATNNSVQKIPQSWSVLQPHMNLYTKDSPTNPIDVLQGNQSSFGTPHNSLFLLVHGFRSNGNKTWLLETKDALLSKNETFLVMIVDWNACKLGFTPGAYFQVAINSYAVGAILAYGLQKYLVKPSCIEPENVHLIGHSVGAHLVATAGSTFYSVTGRRIGKITGLDPAGPWFGDKDATLRLDKTDAQYVEAFHTNGRNDNGTSALSPTNAVLRSKYGVRNPDGHIDFYINGGVRQPKCHLLRPSIMCSHLRAHEYFTESVRTSCKFIGFHCTGNTTDEQVINCFHGNYTTSSRAVMGLHIPKVKHVGVYYVITTNDTSAFCDKEIDKKYPTP